MANATISIPAKTWTALNSTDVTAIRIQNWGKSPAYIMATTGAAPTANDISGSIMLQPGVIITADIEITAMFPGVTGADRFFAYSLKAIELSISHA
jgi:hypothetical protein